MADIKLKIPADLKRKVKEDELNVSEFLTLRLYEYYEKKNRYNINKNVDDIFKND